jgi:hypothetical protein
MKYEKKRGKVRRAYVVLCTLKDEGEVSIFANC